MVITYVKFTLKLLNTADQRKTGFQQAGVHPSPEVPLTLNYILSENL